ncbi:MAG: hypothetical protein ABIK45_00480 [Pseudomonadota bacterium]
MPRLILSLCLSTLVSFMAFPAGAFSSDEGELARALRSQYGGLTSWEAVMTFSDHPGFSAHVWQSRGRWRQEWTFPAAVPVEGPVPALADGPPEGSAVASGEAPADTAGDMPAASSGAAEALAVAVGTNERVVASCLDGGFAMSPLVLWLPADPVARWKAWGVDTAERSYEFCGDAPCLRLGAESGDVAGGEAGPAVWLHNENMAPLMLRYRAGDRVVSIDFDSYLTKSGFRLPGRVTVRAGEAVVVATVRWVAVNRADSEALYARETISSRSCATPPLPFDILRDTVRHPTAE